MVSIIIPAYNEGRTVARVVRAVLGHPLVGEVIVVDDGSTDATAAAAGQAGARVVRLGRNAGKAAAMHEGVRHASCHIVFFVDADLSGINHAIMTKIIEPVMRGECDMCVGVRVRKSPLFNAVSDALPVISGQRALLKTVWNMVPESSRQGFRIELALNYVARQTQRGMKCVPIEGVGQVIKEKKHGLIRGLRYRFNMIADVVRVCLDLYIIDMLRRAIVALAPSRIQ